MSRWAVDDDDPDRWEPRPNADCTDCGAPFVRSPADVGTLCDACCSQRDEHTTAVERRMAKARLKVKARAAVVAVALVPIAEAAGVVDVALVPVPVTDPDGRALRRMASAILAADLTTIPEVA